MKIKRMNKRGDLEAPGTAGSVLIVVLIVVVIALFIWMVYSGVINIKETFAKGINIDLVRTACQTDCSITGYYDYCYVPKEVKYENQKGKEKSFEATCDEIKKGEGMARILPQNVLEQFPDCPEANCQNLKTGMCKLKAGLSSATLCEDMLTGKEGLTDAQKKTTCETQKDCKYDASKTPSCTGLIKPCGSFDNDYSGCVHQDGCVWLGTSS